MFKETFSRHVLDAAAASPSGIAYLDTLESLGIGKPATLRVTMSRLGKRGALLRLKRGVYSAQPMRDAFACAQAVFNGYLGFTSALYLHGIITELPFAVTVVTTGTSKVKKFGEYEFRAVSLKEKAVGFERKEGHIISTRAKTLFDCLYLPEYGIEREKLIAAFKEAHLSNAEWREFDDYMQRFARGDALARMKRAKREIRGV